jgi:hypothetical protein
MLAKPGRDGTRQGVAAPTPQICSTGEAAKSTLLPPLRAQYHKQALKSLQADTAVRDRYSVLC